VVILNEGSSLLGLDLVEVIEDVGYTGSDILEHLYVKEFVGSYVKIRRWL
jgi:hypothetical protein